MRRIAKFEGLEPPPCRDIKGNEHPKKARKVWGLLRNRPMAPIAEKVGKHYPLDEPLYSGQSAVKIRGGRLAQWSSTTPPTSTIFISGMSLSRSQHDSMVSSGHCGFLPG